jgi:hypothetical protein
MGEFTTLLNLGESRGWVGRVESGIKHGKPGEPRTVRIGVNFGHKNSGFKLLLLLMVGWICCFDKVEVPYQY